MIKVQPVTTTPELSEPIDEVLESLARHDQASRSLEVLADALERELEPAWCAIGVGGRDRPRLFHSEALPGDALEVLHTYNASRLFSASPGTLQVIDAPELPGDEALAKAMGKAGMSSAWLLAVGRPTSGRVSAGIVLFRPGHRPPSVAELVLLRRYQNLAAVIVSRLFSDEHRQYQSRHDRLTGFPNRDAVLNRISTAINRRGTDQLALLCVDVDRFGSVNESYGRPAGDEVLRAVANRIDSVVRPADLVGRLDGDAFAVVCERLATQAGAEAMSLRIVRAVAEPMVIEGRPVVLTASVGIASGASLTDAASDGHHADRRPDTAWAAEELLQRASSAVGRGQSGGRITVYRADVRAGAAADLELEAALRAAFDHRDLTVAYQLQVEAVGHRIVGAEALLRWDLDGIAIKPDVFVPLAERSGLIIPIGEWVLAQAAVALAGWDRAVPGNDVAVTVNLSGRQLTDPELEASIGAVLAETGVDPARLWLEITETALVNDPEAAAARLSRLKALGLGVAIDDFGTGYASLDYLRRFPMADVLKIDRTFVDSVAQPGTKDAAIVAASVTLARSLGMVTVAEGVETAAQAAVLTELGCDRLQGNLFGEPIAAAPLGELLGRRRAAER